MMDPVHNGYSATGYGGGNAPWQPQKGGGSYAY
jgi:hypothetical protein